MPFVLNLQCLVLREEIKDTASMYRDRLISHILRYGRIVRFAFRDGNHLSSGLGDGPANADIWNQTNSHLPKIDDTIPLHSSLHRVEFHLAEAFPIV